MTPYYADDLVTLFLGDCRDIVPHLQADTVLTDPPYGVSKAAWDTAFVLPPLPASTSVLGLMPGVANITACPDTWGGLGYRWTLVGHVSNGMTRGAFGFGNFIPLLVYAASSVGLHQMAQDCRDFAIRGDMPDHPSPKPLAVVSWFLSMLPGETVLDPFVGSGTTLVAAKAAGRRSIGIDIDERSCEEAARRCSQEVLGLSA